MIMNELQKYIHISKYARWIDEEKRRETWEETCKRYSYFFADIFPKHSNIIQNELRDAVLNMEVMPSMRAMWTAGKALNRDNVSAYNCAGIAVNHIRVFDEVFYLLMCGCGVGFSVERQYINKLPDLPEELYETDTVIRVRDSKIGWASGLKELISFLYAGSIPTWDLSGIRPEGARLNTFGGRASGPGPLNNLFLFITNTFKRTVKEGKIKLNSLEVHDILCNIASAVVAGNVRRAACISLSNLTDDRMRRAKMGNWSDGYGYRSLANNSVAYTEKPDLESFLKEWYSLYKSKSGERGVINKEALRDKAESCGRVWEGDYLLNPCGEAILRDSGGLCNLTEVVVRPKDSLEDLKRKVKYATILGTLQSTLTSFRYLRKVWRDNAEEERLLGVSLTGIMDHPVMSGRSDEWGKVELDPYRPGILLQNTLRELKQVAKETNEEWAEKLGIPASKQLTLVKPSGTVSKLTDSSAGIHQRYAPYYIQRVTQDKGDPVTQLLLDAGVPYLMNADKSKYYFAFYIKAPEGSVTGDDIDAMYQLELWKTYRDHWCQGNPSQTIYYNQDNYFKVADWLWNNWDSVGGLSFFQKDDNVYPIMMQEEISKEEYEEAMESYPVIPWEKLSEYEEEDCGTGAHEVACMGGSCEVL